MKYLPYTNKEVCQYLVIGNVVKELCDRGYEDRLCKELVDDIDGMGITEIKEFLKQYPDKRIFNKMRATTYDSKNKIISIKEWDITEEKNAETLGNILNKR